MKQRRKRPRPHIPDSVKVQVAHRQLSPSIIIRINGESLPHYLDRLLTILAAHLNSTRTDLRLDHNPALNLREFNARTRTYTPDANDPTALVYRDSHSHHIKTNVRGDGAHRSDTSERVYRRKVEKNKAKRRVTKCPPAVPNKTRKIPSRPFPAVSRPMEAPRRPPGGPGEAPRRPAAKERLL